ncbi:MAG: penicillin acylase family protein [Betaproteobacteria bacterium]
MRSSARRFLRLSVTIVFTLVVLAGVGVYAYQRLSLPQTTGEVAVPGLGSAVEVVRDTFGVPHIFAANWDDAAYALGYVHAQDRLWQLEINRRIGSGRLAEVLGPAALDTDRFLRTLGVRRVAEANLANFDDATRRHLAAYADGVNAFLATKPVLPAEFLLTGTRPEPWSPIDSLVWAKMMAWDLGGNWRTELLRMRLAKTLTTARIHEFLPPYPGEAPLEITDLAALYGSLDSEAVRLAGGDMERVIATAPPGLPEGAGSNNWVVGGSRSASGKPLLANDPHLALSAPAIWYFAHLHAAGENLIGATLPGLPVVTLGRNDSVAWGFTNTGPDVQDLYLERLNPAGGYDTPAGPAAFKVRTEIIKVKGAEDVRLEVRLSRHGPIISDVSRVALDAAPRGYAVAFAWMALAEDDRTVEASIGLSRAHNWKDFTAATKKLTAPQQNILYADIGGNIGFIAAGRVPVRRPDNDLKGLAPAPGWLAKYDWTGFIPFEDLPQSYNPASDRLWSANEKITAPGYQPFITSEWQPPYRSTRIGELIEATPRHDAASFAHMHADVLSLAMREAMPYLLATQPRSERARKALAMLARWNGEMRKDFAEPLILAAWWRELTRVIYADELGDAFQSSWSPRAPFMVNVLADHAGQSRWCDNVRTPAPETCAEALAVSLEAGLADLERRYGTDMAQWRWGEAHKARLEHRPFGKHPLLSRLFDISVPTAGDAYTVNVGQHHLNDEAMPFANRHAASLRAIYDLADPEKSLFIHSGGQSGNLLSPHYRSFTEAWANGDYIPMITNRQRLEAERHSTLRLVPAP